MLGLDVRETVAHAVDRPELRRQLDEGLATPLSLVVAPAGAGKTVLLTEWAASHPDIPIAWLDIAATDSDALVLSRRLAAAVTAVSPVFRAPDSPMVATDGRLGERYLEELSVALADVGDIVVVFDDLDRIVGTAVLTDLWRLVDTMPSTAHFVFASRTDLQLGWSRHRLRYGLVEIRQRSLAFDDDTTGAVLARITGRHLSAETAAEVTARTEGWAVGVQLTALSLRASADPDRVVETMTGTDRLVMDYLSEEVLDAMDADRRAALLQLAVLDEVCPALAEAVTGLDGDDLLAGLERDSMFVVPVIGRPGWFRFHRLFRDLLLLRLRARTPSVEAGLLGAAGRWHLASGDVETAIECFLRARDWRRALDLVRAVGAEFYEGQRMATVARWLGAVPAHVRMRDVDAQILFAMAQALSGRAAEAIDALRLLAGDHRLGVGQRQIVLTTLAGCVQFDPHPEHFLATAEEALALLAAHPDAERPDLIGLTSFPLLLAAARLAHGRALLFLGHVTAASERLREALDDIGPGYRSYRIHVLGALALADALLGRLVEAAELAEEALGLAAEAGLLTHPSPADAHLARAIVAVQRGEPEAAAIALHDATLRATSDERTQLQWLCRVVSTLIDPDAALVDDGEPRGPRPAIVRDGLAGIALCRARLAGAVVAPPAPARAWSYVAFEEIAGLLAVGHVEEAKTRFAQLRPESRPGIPVPDVECALLLAWIAAIEGRQGALREQLGIALRLAEPEWLVHPFVRLGPVAADLVGTLPGSENEFHGVVAARARAVVASRTTPAVGLTPREVELLAFLPTRLTIPDIAARSYVSTNTVKTHLGHIYRKLEVQGRDAAVERARELGLIDFAGRISLV